MNQEIDRIQPQTPLPGNTPPSPIKRLTKKEIRNLSRQEKANYTAQIMV